MAVTTPIKPLINKNLRRSGASSARQTVNKVSNILKNNSKEKNSIFSKKLSYRRRREEYERRAQLEDRLEANKIGTNLFTPLKTAQAVGGGIFKRIINTIAYLGAGWILRNAPTWIAMGKEFIARVQETGTILKGFVSNVYNIFFQFGNLLSSVGQNIIQFDFFDSTKRVSNSFDELLGTIDNMGSKIEEAFSIFTTPLSEGKYSGEDAPPPGTNAPSETYERPGFGGSGPGSASSGNQYERAFLDMLAVAEGTTKSYGTMYGGKVNKDLASGNLTVRQSIQIGDENARKEGSGATGRYQFMPFTLENLVRLGVLRMDEKFTPQKQDKAAIALAKGRGIDPSKKLRKNDMYRLGGEWASIEGGPNMVPGGSYGNQARYSADSALKIYESKLNSSSQEQSISQNQSQQSSSITAPQNFKGTFIQGSTGRSTGPHFHFGPGPATAKVAQQGNMFPGKYYSDAREVAFNVAKYFLRQKKGFLLSRSKRDIGPGISDSELKNAIYEEQRVHTRKGSDGGIDMALTGNPVLPLAVSDVKDYNDGFGISGTITGKNVFVGHGLRGSKSGAGVNNISSSAEEPQISSASAQEPGALTPERTGQSMFIIDQILPPSSPQSTSAANFSMPSLQPPQTNESDMLNNFIKTKLLLDLAYL